MGKLRNRAFAILAAGSAILSACVILAEAANQGEVDEKFQIPVPVEQRKIAPGQEKTFQEGRLAVHILSAERTKIEISVNGSDYLLLPIATKTLHDIGQEQICTMVFLGLSGEKAIVSARCDQENEDLRAALIEQQGTGAIEIVDPIDLIAKTEPGKLKNPYLGQNAAIAKGRQLYLANSCNGCHGGNGGGGMGPPLSNGVWIYGSEDDTLFRLIILGSDEMLARGYSRVASEKVLGPMPPFEGIIENADDLWKILAFVRSTSPEDAP